MSKKTAERKFIGVKDLILGILLSLVVVVIFFMITPLVQPLGLWGSSLTSPIIPILLGGTIYVLLSRKSPRIGIHLAFVFPWIIMFIVSGTPITSLMLLVSGIIGEIVMLRGWGKKWRPLVPYTLHWLTNVFGATVPMVFFPQNTISTFMGSGMDEATATMLLDNLLVVYTDPLFIIACVSLSVVLSIIGYAIGIKVLAKHFKGAGVA